MADRAGQAPAVADRREPVPGRGEVHGSGWGVAAHLRREPPVQAAVGSQPWVGVVDQIAELGRARLLVVQQREDERHGWMRGVARQLGGTGRGTLPALEVLDREVMHRIVAERGGQRVARHAPGVAIGGCRVARHTLGVGPGQRQRLAQPACRLSVVAAHCPVPAERCRQAHRGLGVGGADRVAQRRAEVVRFTAQPGQVGELTAAAKLRIRSLGPGQEVTRVSPPEPGGLTRLVQRRLGVRADGVQHPVPGWRVRYVPELGERLVGQRAEQPQHRAGRQALVRAHRLGRLRCRAASEHGEPAGQRAFGVGKQVPAPPDDRDQRLVPRQRGPAAAGQQPEPVVEARGELGGRQRAQPGAGQLDGQRQAVEAAADLGHRWQVLGGQPEPETPRPRRGRRTAAARGSPWLPRGRPLAAAPAAAPPGRPARPGWSAARGTWRGSARLGSRLGRRGPAGRRRRGGARSCRARSAAAARRVAKPAPPRRAASRARRRRPRKPRPGP